MPGWCLTKQSLCSAQLCMCRSLQENGKFVQLIFSTRIPRFDYNKHQLTPQRGGRGREGFSVLKEVAAAASILSGLEKPFPAFSAPFSAASGLSSPLLPFNSSFPSYAQLNAHRLDDDDNNSNPRHTPPPSLLSPGRGRGQILPPSQSVRGGRL